MSAPIFFAAYFQLSIERAGRRPNDIGAQDAEPFTRLHQFFVVKRSDKFTVIVFANSRKAIGLDIATTIGVAEERKEILTHA